MSDWIDTLLLGGYETSHLYHQGKESIKMSAKAPQKLDTSVN